MRKMLFSLTLLASASLSTVADAQSARVRIVATGGTIAGAQAKAGDHAAITRDYPSTQQIAPMDRVLSLKPLEQGIRIGKVPAAKVLVFFKRCRIV